MKPITKYTLFDYVSSNNLTKLIELADKKDLTVYKEHTCLIGRAIEVRAKECFDYLYKKQKDGDSSISDRAFYIAIDYYIDNPTLEHKYYLDKLLELDTNIESHIIGHTIGSNELFNLFFEKMEKTYDEIMNLVWEIYRRKNFDRFKQIYEWIELNYQIYNLDLDSFKKEFVDYSYNFECVDFLIYLESKNANILLYDDMTGLYKANQYITSKIFDYIIEKYKTLTLEQLNAIPGIQNLKNYKLSTNLNTKQLLNFKKILELPIDFVSDSVKNYLNDLYSDIIILKSMFEYDFGFIYLILKKYPHINILNNVSNDIIKKSLVHLTNHIQNGLDVQQQIDMNYLRKLMCIHMKFSTLPVSYSESNILRQIILEPNFSQNQTKYLEYLEQVLSGKIKLNHYKF